MQSLLSSFPESWPARLNGLSYSETKLAELKPRFEENWFRQTNLHLDLTDEQLTALIELADEIWSNETLRLYSLVTSHFLFNASDNELLTFTWPIEAIEKTGIRHNGLFYLLSYLTHIDTAIQIYREQRITLDLFAQTAARIKDFIHVDRDGQFVFSNYVYLSWLCEGKVISINGLLYLPGRWEDNYSIWRNGLSGELREEAIPAGKAQDHMAIIAAAKDQGLDLNLWQLKLKPSDKVLTVIDMRDNLTEAEINHSLVQADRFFKDPDHFHNFVAYDFRSCRTSIHEREEAVILREEL